MSHCKGTWPTIIKKKQKNKIGSTETTDFRDKEIPKVCSNYTCLVVILIDFVLKKMKTIIRKCFQKNANTLKKKKN